MTFGSLRPDSAITSAPGRTAWTRRAISATRCSGLESTIAWIASSRRPSRWKSRDPVLGALAHPLADGVALLVVDVEARAPGRLVLVGEVRAEGHQRLGAGGADVVVDDVEDHGQARGVGGVDELLQAQRAAVGGLGGAQVDAVVAPAARARELGHGHQLDRGHAELGQLAQVRDRALERALGRERADVQLVDHGVLQAGDAEAAVGPLEGERVDDPRRARAGPPAASASTGRAAACRRARTRSRRPAPASTVAS